MLAAPNTLNILLAGAVALLVLSAWLGGVLVWSIRRRRHMNRVQQNLGLLIEPSGQRELRLWHDGKEVITTVPGLRPRRPLMQRLEALCFSAGWHVGVKSLALGLAGACLLAFVVMLALTHSAVVAFIAPGTLTAGFWIYLKQRVAAQEATFEKQLLDALDLAARSLRAGHPLAGSFNVIAEEIPPPVGHIFAKIGQQQAIGVGLEEALAQAAADANHPDLRLFATSVAIQLRAGGNLTDMMDRLSTVIRNRMWLSRRVRVLTAQTQFSKRLLLTLPFVVFVALNLLNPLYMKPLYTTPMGQWMLGIGATMMIAGAWVMNRMSVLKY